MVLLIDVLGTLVYEPFFREVPRALGMTLDEVLEAKHPTAWVEFECGSIDESELRRRFFRDGRAYDHEGLKAAMTAAYSWIDGTEALLGDLKSAGCELHLMSNYPVWYQLIEDKLGLSRYAPWTFVSCCTGLRKPAPEAYLHVARTLSCAPAELLLIDDRESNCRGAREMGMQAIRFESAAATRRELRNCGVL
jgi:HAD superfamily hydrolase (TIGR01509 family)